MLIRVVESTWILNCRVEKNGKEYCGAEKWPHFQGTLHQLGRFVGKETISIVFRLIFFLIIPTIVTPYSCMFDQRCNNSIVICVLLSLKDLLSMTTTEHKFLLLRLEIRRWRDFCFIFENLYFNLYIQTLFVFPLNLNFYQSLLLSLSLPLFLVLASSVSACQHF